jgi:hypothetical protein
MTNLLKNHDSTTLEAVVSIGVTPLETTIFGVTVPLYRMIPAPLDAVPMLKNVSVSDPPVAAGNEILATGVMVCPEIAQPPEVRATATRA